MTTNLTNVVLAHTGRNQAANSLGMRPMQERAYGFRNAQYLLVKAPPASGKSRALMFIALDKLENQGIAKVIVSVPERSIGGSFASTELTKDGFPHDWVVNKKWDLTDAAGTSGKAETFRQFMDSDDRVLICAHATLRNAFEALGIDAFSNALVVIDEFHHVSADAENQLGEIVRALMADGRPHIVAMTGSYFRGDAVPVLRPEDEDKFTRVTYTYYDQLNGYQYLKTLGIGYHFYRGAYVEAIGEVIDAGLKTIIHIPRPNSSEATPNKYEEVNRILDHIGTVRGRDESTGFYIVERPDGGILKIADLVDESDQRDKVMRSLRAVSDRDEVDVVIALGMAKEGFDWIWCEHALTVGYRSSLTEIIQIIGRTTRDAPGKTHAQFTNLIAKPDAMKDNVVKAVNDMLKAIACSLLMEQVLAPNFSFKTRPGDDLADGNRPPTVVSDGKTAIAIKGFKEPSTARSRQIVEDDLDTLVVKIIQADKIAKASLSGAVAPEVVNQVFIREIIEKTYEGITPDEVAEVTDAVLATIYLKNAARGEADTGTVSTADGDNDSQSSVKFVELSTKFINIETLDIGLIRAINPFQRAYEVLSKTLTEDVLRRIHGEVAAETIPMKKEEAIALWNRIKEFKKNHGREPGLTALDPMEKRMAMALALLRKLKRSQDANQAGAGSADQ